MGITDMERKKKAKGHKIYSGQTYPKMGLNLYSTLSLEVDPLVGGLFLLASEPPLRQSLLALQQFFFKPKNSSREKERKILR